MDKLSIVIGNYIDVECDANTTPRQAYERGFRRATEKYETVICSRKIENDQLKSKNASLMGAAQGLGELCDRYKAENAKLRELLEEVIGDSVDEYDLWRYRDRLRELGVEAPHD